jgi:oligopeptidase A
MPFAIALTACQEFMDGGYRLTTDLPSPNRNQPTRLPFRGTTTDAADMDNPLLAFASIGSLPPFSIVKAVHVEPATTALLTALKSGQAALEARVAQDQAPTFASLVEAMVDLVEPLERAWGLVGHLLSVRNSDELRAAHERMQPMVVAATIALAQSVPLYAALVRVAARTDLTATQRRIVDRKLLEAKLSGIALQGDEQVKFNAIETELSELSTSFSNHVLDATKAWSWLIEDPALLDGLPLSARNQLAQNAKRSHPEATIEGGPWLLTLDFPSFSPVMRYARRSDVRERLYRAYLARASELDGGTWNNQQAIERIRQLRQQKAGLLGFASFAALSVSQKMAGSVAAVQQLLGELREVSLHVAKEELAELQRLQSTPVRHWDVEYLSEQLRVARYAYSEEDLRPYFPLPRVLHGMFWVAKELFDIEVVERDANIDVWHSDVRYYDVRRDGAIIAGFFLDPYARPADKRGGAWMDECVVRRRQNDGSARTPVAYLCCNQSPPADGKPSLMTFRDVETLFHEFGHGLQHMMTVVDEADASGIRGVEWDAVELPSQFMENWCFDERVVERMSAHVDTGASLPTELLDKVKRAKTFRAASVMLRQLFFASLDLELHTRSDNAMQLQRDLARDNAVLQPLDEDRFLCSFSHIFAGGYAAGYYSYKWAEVLSADAFAAFEEGPGLTSSEHVRRTGRRFRDTVLALGGSVHPMEVFAQLRGRAPSTAALLRHAGLQRA